MKNYKIQEREAGNVIETNLSLKEAEKMLKSFENQDKKEGSYTPNFYEIKEIPFFKVVSNKQKRHFTIYKNGNKYRADLLSKEEFEQMEEWVESDWNNFLKTSTSYTLCKK